MNLLGRIDGFLNSITMYRLVLYSLLVLAGLSVGLGFFGILPYGGFSFLISLMVLLGVCYFGNLLIARVFRAVTNVESSLISACILFFIFSPVGNTDDAVTLVLAGIIAMGSKYILAIERKHVFNPAAVAAFILGVLGNGNVIWWVGSAVLLPFVAVMGVLIARKIRRFDLFLSFLVVSVATLFVTGVYVLPFHLLLVEIFSSWPILFFGTVMLTEPLTTPPTRRLQVLYGSIVGVLFSSQFHFGPLYSTPELALLVGNIFSYLVSSRQKLRLVLREKVKVAVDIYEFVFSTNQKLRFTAGQYLEWTLPHSHPDSRGNRRYFTIASSPTEEDLRLGVRIGLQASSSFKKKLSELTQHDRIMVAQLAGDFTLPAKGDKKFVFIAGGIGITPFRSMVKYLVDKKEHKSIVLFYVNKTESEIAYRDVFDEARSVIGLKTVYVLTDMENIPNNWSGKKGRIDEKMIAEDVPDYKERVFYLSGPNMMVMAYKRLLIKMGVSRRNIVTDYFPGY